MTKLLIIISVLFSQSVYAYKITDDIIIDRAIKDFDCISIAVIAGAAIVDTNEKSYDYMLPRRRGRTIQGSLSC